MRTIIVWFRNDLRVYDHPALAQAVKDADRIIPVFIFDANILHGVHSGSNRNRFLLESLADLRQSLQDRGGDLIVRSGKHVAALADIAHEYDAQAVYYTADYSPYALKRDALVAKSLKLEFRGFAGRLIVSSLPKLQTKNGKVHRVFTPFWKNWLEIGRRDIAPTPEKIALPTSITPGDLPDLSDITIADDLSPNVVRGGETAARKRLKAFLDGPIHKYHQGNNDMAADDTSRLSSYLHFGCLSPREIETMLPDGDGPRAWHRQLCWREFYHYVLFNFPDNNKQEFQERYRNLQWDNNERLLQAWIDGKTGYPVVDAAMRQLKQEGWMHNRARLIVGSFLTKDLWLDWRLGERYFMRILLDGDEANNNGNWQWIASVGVDPAPVFRRLYNPTLQQQSYDPTGKYVRKYLPELQHVPDKFLAEPWKMSSVEQHNHQCVIGTDYPAPIVDHSEARKQALERYRQSAI